MSLSQSTFLMPLEIFVKFLSDLRVCARTFSLAFPVTWSNFSINPDSSCKWAFFHSSSSVDTYSNTFDISVVCCWDSSLNLSKSSSLPASDFAYSSRLLSYSLDKFNFTYKIDVCNSSKKSKTTCIGSHVSGFRVLVTTFLVVSDTIASSTLSGSIPSCLLLITSTSLFTASVSWTISRKSSSRERYTVRNKVSEFAPYSNNVPPVNASKSLVMLA